MKTIVFGKPMIDDAERQAVMEVLKGSLLVHGPKAKEFEKSFAAFAKADHAVSMSSCTAALHLSYFTFGIGEGDEVIVPAQTHVATAHAVEFVGAKPVFVDAELETGNIDIQQIEEKITNKTKAISLVHFLGMPVDMPALLQIAEKYNLKVIEDCALAIGSTINGVHAGLWGDTGSFSFYPVKHMTTAEGGMLITKHKDLAEKLTRQKAFGVDRTVTERKVPGVYDVNMLGYNYRMNEMQAAIGIEQVKKISGFLAQRKANYEYLENNLEEVKEISLFNVKRKGFQSSYYCFSLLLNSALVEKRYEIVKYLNEKGVGTSIYYPRPVPHMKYYKDKYGYTDETFPNASRISYKSIALPVGPHLKEDDMQYIVEQVKGAVTHYSD